MKVPYKIVRRSDYGFNQLSPLPSAEEIDQYYRDKYYANIRQGGRADEMRRLLEVDEEAKAQREWLEQTFYGDVLDIIQTQAVGHRVLDVGCGTGDLIDYLSRQGLAVTGVEPSADLAKAARAKGLEVRGGTMDDFVGERRGRSGQFDVIVLLNVLEHVTQPIELLQQCQSQLRSGGILMVRVPNDFSQLQLAAYNKLGKRPWWVTMPDHINYFSNESLRATLEGVGFEVVDSLADFPMEVFLLMGEDYVDNPEVGKQCHQRRVAFELSMPTSLRRQMYRQWAGIGIGRTCTMVGRVKQ